MWDCDIEVNVMELFFFIKFLKIIFELKFYLKFILGWGVGIQKQNFNIFFIRVFFRVDNIYLSIMVLEDYFFKRNESFVLENYILY